MKKIKIFFLILFFFNSNVFANNNIDFEKWKNEFKKRALANDISEKTFQLLLKTLEHSVEKMQLMLSLEGFAATSRQLGWERSRSPSFASDTWQPR